MVSSTIDRVLRRAARFIRERDESEREDRQYGASMRDGRRRPVRKRDERERAVARRVRRDTERNIAHHARMGAGELEQRLAELDQEWDLERALLAGAGSVTMLAGVLGMLSSPLWLAVATIAGGTMLQQALHGDSLPQSLLRRLGFRKRSEIDLERYALKLLRGDLAGLPGLDEVAGDPSRVRVILEALMRGSKAAEDSGPRHE